MKSETKTRLKAVALAHLMLASCFGWSCTADLRDAAWAGVLDYVSATTTDLLANAWTPADLFPTE